MADLEDLHGSNPMNAGLMQTASRLIAEDEPNPVIAHNPGGFSPLVLICDHAGRAVPRRLGRLGLAEEAFGRHIAWDIGAGAVAERLGAMLDAVVLRQAYSRLVIDCNRPLDTQSLIAEESDGTPVPGNLGLDAADRAARIEEIYQPYHRAIDAAIDARQARGQQPIVVSIHSFTPTMDGFARPWSFGVLHAGDSPLSARVLERLRAEGLEVGDNQPYALGPLDCSIPRHAQARSLDYLELEIRQDLIEADAGQAWAAEVVGRVLGDGVAYRVP
jgi:predicted N-formylglutamate amidohydrolase